MSWHEEVTHRRAGDRLRMAIEGAIMGFKDKNDWTRDMIIAALERVKFNELQETLPNEDADY